MTKMSGNKLTASHEWTGPSAVLGRKTTFTATELMKRYPDGNIPDMPGREERRVRKLARRRLAEAGIIFQASPDGGQSTTHQTEATMSTPQYAHRDAVKAGTQLRADGGFTCINEGAALVVEEDESGLFIPCEEGRHYIDGQLDNGDVYIGLTLAAT